MSAHRSKNRQIANRLFHRACTAWAALLVALCAPVLLGGCGVAPAATRASAATALPAGMTGTVRGGQQPIAGATVQLWAVGTTGDGSTATPLLTRSVTTNSDGTFSLTGLYQCPSPSANVYLTALGGNPGLVAGTVNPQIALMMAIGPCGQLTPSTELVVNELTTVASVETLAPFMQSVAAVGAGPADAAALAAAFTTAQVLFNPATGTSPGTNIPTGSTVPVTTLNTLADLLEACVNSAGGVAGDGTSCGSLFTNTTQTTGTAPTDTITAALVIANHPTQNQAQLFSLLNAVATFIPALTQAPSTWSAQPVAQSAPQIEQLVFLTSPASATAGATLAPAVQVAVEDGNGTRLTGQTGTVTLALAGGIAGATLGGITSASVVAGVATFPNLTIATAGGPYALAATMPGAGSTTSAVFQVAPAALPNVSARAADSFVNSVGLNVHFSYYGSIYTNQSAQMIANLQSLGVRHLRDQMAWEGTVLSVSPFYAIHNQLAPLGIHTDYIMTSLTYPISQVALYPTLVSDMEAAEPANEADASGDANWVADITAQATSLHTQVQTGGAAFAGVTVLAPSLAQPAYAPQLGNVSGISDAGNSHPYFSGWNPGNSGTGGANNPAYFMNLARVNNPTQPIWVTETGYWSTPGTYDGGYGVDEATQAVYLPRTLLEFWNAGAARSYVYELADWLQGQSFGLVRGDGSRKPSFGALANLLALLSDPGTSFTPGVLGYQLTGADSKVQQALFQKADGSFYLAVWVEAQSYDFLAQKAITVPAESITLQLNAAPFAATSYQWDSAGNVTTSALPVSKSMALTVTDKLQIVKLVLP